MAQLKEVIGYLCTRYPHPNELAKGRVAKLVFLADWLTCLKSGEQMTAIQWHFNNYGPYVEDIVTAARNDAVHFSVVEKENVYGNPIDLIKVKKQFEEFRTLSHSERQTLDKVVEAVEAMNWSQFISHVYSTYPIATRERYSRLNLKEIAGELTDRQRMREEALLTKRSDT